MSKSTVIILIAVILISIIGGVLACVVLLRVDDAVGLRDRVTTAAVGAMAAGAGAVAAGAGAVAAGAAVRGPDKSEDGMSTTTNPMSDMELADEPLEQD